MRRAVSREALHACAVGGQNGFVDSRSLLFQPGQQRGAEIEADFLEVVHDLNDEVLAVENA